MNSNHDNWTDFAADVSVHAVWRVMYPPAAPPVEPDIHDWHEAIHIVDGDYEVEIAGRRHQASAGDTLIYPAGLEHLPRLRADFSRFIVVQWHADPGPTRFSRHDDPTGHIGRMFAWMWQVYFDQSSAGQSLLDQQWRTVLTALAQPPDAPTTKLEQIAAYLRDHPRTEVSIDEVVHHFDISPRHLARLFKKKYGVTTKEYADRSRVERAVNRLISTHDTLDDIAEACGYTSKQTLTRHIQKYFGRSPTALRSGQAPD